MSRTRDELLNAFLDDALDTVERSSVERDVARDATLAAEFAALRDLDTTLRNMRAPAANDAALVRVIENALRPKPRPFSPWPLVLATALGLAAGLLARIDLASRDSTPVTPVVIAPPWTSNATAIGRVAFVVGAPMRLVPNSKDSSELAVDATLAAEDTVFLLEDDQMIVELRDGGHHWFDANSTLGWGIDGNLEIRSGRAVIASAAGETAGFDALQQSFAITDGACHIGIDAFQGKVAKRAPTQILRITVIRGELAIGDRRFAAGSSLAIEDGVISDGYPPLDSQWFVELATRVSPR